MKIRFPLYAQIVSFLILHLTLLVVLFLCLFNSQFGIGWEPLVYSPVGDRVEAIGWAIHQQARATPTSDWNGILEDYGKVYGVNFYLFDSHGRQQAGSPISLPSQLEAKLKMRMPPFGTMPPLVPPTLDQPPPPLNDDVTAGSAPATSDLSTVIAPTHAPGTEPASAPSLPAATRQQPVTNPSLATSTATRMLPPVPFPRHHMRFFLHTRNPDTFWIGVRFPMRNRREGPGTLLVASTSLWQSKLFLDFELFAAAIVGILAFSVLVWWPFVHQLTRALAELTSATSKIAEGRFDVRLEVKRSDEIGRLAEAINVMSGRLNTFVTGQKRFLGDIAHELCSPVARLQVALEILEDSSSERQATTIKDVKEEVEEMRSLIDELLAFSRAGLRGKETQLVPVELEPILKSAVARACAGDSVTLDMAPGLCALADSTLIERALTNILRNCHRYAAKDGPISVRSSRSGKNVILCVTDCGPGVPAEALQHLGEPFFRPEPSRSRSSGGVGLGLAIVKTCVEACEGTFAARNRQPSGLEVVITLNFCEAEGRSHASPLTSSLL
jgi:two-component system sensor histidine kinase CpxA